MSLDPAAIALARCLCGQFDNAIQARDKPTWFVPTCLWQRPLPQPVDGHFAIFIEQAPLLQLQQPYRQRLLLLQSGQDSSLQVVYRALRDPQAFAGAATQPERLVQLTPGDLQELPGCVLNVVERGGTFVAEPPAGATCCFEYEGKTRQVVLGFEASAEGLRSFDRGVDPETGRGLWGALMGAYEYLKVEAFPLPPV